MLIANKRRMPLATPDFAPRRRRSGVEASNVAATQHLLRAIRLVSPGLELNPVPRTQVESSSRPRMDRPALRCSGNSRVVSRHFEARNHSRVATKSGGESGFSLHREVAQAVH